MLDVGQSEAELLIALSRQIDQLSRDLERLTAEWRTFEARVEPLVRTAEKISIPKWLVR